jgi:hypothetical protein
MADQKISQLTAATSVTGTDIIPIVQSSTTKSATFSIIKDYIISAITTTSQVAGSNFTTTSLSLVNITGLTFAAAANTTYEINVLLRVQSTSTAGLTPGINYSAAGATVSVTGSGVTTANNVTAFGLSALNTATTPAYATVANVDRNIIMQGVLITGANTGNITIQIAKVTSGTATVYIGSRMSVALLA